MDLGFFIFFIIFIMIAVIILIVKRGGFKINEKIEALWKTAGMETRILKERFLGITLKKVIALKKEPKYLMIGMNWTVSSGRNQVPYWGIGLFFNNEIMKFSITKRKPNFFDGKRIKLNDPELDKMLVLKCKDENWFRMTFNEDVLMELAQSIPKNTTISYEKKLPVRIEEMLEEFGYDTYNPFIIVKRREYITYSKVFNETIKTANDVAKIFLHF